MFHVEHGRQLGECEAQPVPVFFGEACSCTSLTGDDTCKIVPRGTQVGLKDGESKKGQPVRLCRHCCKSSKALSACLQNCSTWDILLYSPLFLD
jgi:hypothetical protein